jgi:opacity protein-like surface antigen
VESVENVALVACSHRRRHFFWQPGKRERWIVGAGLEYKVTRNISLGVEYNYIDLGGENLAGTTATALPVASRDS